VNVKHALALGALDFIPKPCDVERLKDLLVNSLKVQSVELTEQPEDKNGGMLGQSLPMQTLITQIRQFADSPFPVLIEGESAQVKSAWPVIFTVLANAASKPICL